MLPDANAQAEVMYGEDKYRLDVMPEGFNLTHLKTGGHFFEKWDPAKAPSPSMQICDAIVNHQSSIYFFEGRRTDAIVDEVTEELRRRAVWGR